MLEANFVDCFDGGSHNDIDGDIRHNSRDRITVKTRVSTQQRNYCNLEKGRCRHDSECMPNHYITNEKLKDLVLKKGLYFIMTIMRTEKQQADSTEL